MSSLAGKAMWTMAVMAVLGLTTSVAEAGRYNDIDDHARDIEYQASRAQRIVKYDFRRLPVAIQKCLLTNLCGLEDNADCIRDLTRRDGNLDRIVEHVQVMSGQILYPVQVREVEIARLQAILVSIDAHFGFQRKEFFPFYNAAVIRSDTAVSAPCAQHVQ